MDTHAFIPLIATIVYIPLLVILLGARPWDRKQKYFFLFLIAAFLWSFTDIFFRSDFFMPHKLFLAKAGICIMMWVLTQWYYLVSSFYRQRAEKIPLPYIFLLSTIALAVLGYIPRGVEITPSGINVDYGNWIIAVGFIFLLTLGARSIYCLVRRYRVLADPVERNQFTYLFIAIAIFTVFILSSIAPSGGEYPLAHIGNLLNAGILAYAVVRHRLLDVNVVLRRVVTYMGLYAAGVAIIMLVIFLAHLVLGFELDRSTLTAVLAIGIPVILLLFNLVRGAWQERVEQVFGGERYHQRRGLFDFVTQIYDVPTLEQFGKQLVSLLSQSVDSERVCLLLPLVAGGDFAGRFAYPPVEDNPMAVLKLRRDSPVVSWLEGKGRILLRKDLDTLPEFQGLWREEKEDVQSSQVEIFVPLMHGDRLIGTMAIGSKRNGKIYSVEDVDLMESVASRVAVSMEKEYLHEQVKEQSNELTLLNRLTMLVTSSVNVQDMFEGFSRELKEVIDVDWASIALVEGDKLRFLALSSTVGSAWEAEDRISLRGTATEWVITEKRALYETDVSRHRRFWTGEHHLKQGISSIAYLPLISKGRAIGSLIVASRRPDAYSPKQVQLLENVALQIAVPIENCILYAQAEQRARIDELTGLFSRRHFEERLKEEIARHSRYGDAFSLLMLDLDSFKTYNDMYGHPSGDELLHRIGEIVTSSVRSSDQAFRYGGDEFIVILPQTSSEDSYVVAERIRERVAAEMEAMQITVTCSGGLVSYPSDGVMTGELVNAADTALYYAKRTGGNRICLSSAALAETTNEAGTYSRGGSLSTVYALASTVDAKDHYTYGHSRKVNTYAVALAEAIGLSPDEVSKVSTAALLHDIGKIGIPDEILNKKSKLSADERAAINSHPRLGANIVGNVPSLVPCVSGILYHHERWDGKGYPEGLQGEAIPLNARVLAIADAYAAMTSVRPYRDVCSDDKVMEELRKGAGKQFDPMLVEVFIGIVKAGFPHEVVVGKDLTGD